MASNEGTASIEIYFSQTIDGAPAGNSFILPPFEKKDLGCGADLGFNPTTGAVHFTLRNASPTNEVIYRMRIE